MSERKILLKIIIYTLYFKVKKKKKIDEFGEILLEKVYRIPPNCQAQNFSLI